MATKEEILKKVKLKRYYNGKIHIVEKDENGKERKTGNFLCGGMYHCPDFSNLTPEEMEILMKEDCLNKEGHDYE